MGNKRLHP